MGSKHKTPQPRKGGRRRRKVTGTPSQQEFKRLIVQILRRTH